MVVADFVMKKFQEYGCKINLYFKQKVYSKKLFLHRVIIIFFDKLIKNIDKFNLYTFESGIHFTKNYL